MDEINNDYETNLTFILKKPIFINIFLQTKSFFNVPSGKIPKILQISYMKIKLNITLIRYIVREKHMIFKCILSYSLMSHIFSNFFS